MKKINLSKKQLAIIIPIIVLVVLGGAALAFGWFSDGRTSDTDNQQTTYYSQLTGEEVSQEEANRPVLGIMINNSTDARPPQGLDAAGITFETVTEGGITRYLALYQTDLPEEVGPVRSLRSHFLDWAMGFEASIAHVGGSAESLNQVDERSARSLNQFQHDGPYYRTNDRPSPHNMYVRTEGLRQLQQELGHDISQFEDIPREDDNPLETPEAETITINFSGESYQSEFRYNPETNTYTRYLAGEPHVDAATDEPITVKNVIVLKTRDDYPIDATATGTALVFKDGGMQEVRWEKQDYEQRLKIIDEDDNEVPLNRGDSWIAALPSNRTVSY